jgi:hypothetical protein
MNESAWQEAMMVQLPELIRETVESPFGLDGTSDQQFRLMMIDLYFMVSMPQRRVSDDLFIGGSGFLLLVAALINCGLGISALPWSMKYVSPVLVQGPDWSDVLALVPTSVLESDVPTTYALIESYRDSVGIQFVLVAHRKLGNETERMVCYFPSGVKLKAGGLSQIMMD